MRHLSFLTWRLLYRAIFIIDRDDAEAPMRTILTTSDDLVYPGVSPRKFIHADTYLAIGEREVGVFWRLPMFPVPTRITHFIRNSMVGNIEPDKWTALTQSIESIGEYGSCRGRGTQKYAWISAYRCRS